MERRLLRAVLVEATLVGALSAQLRRPGPRSVMSAKRRPRSYRTEGFFDLSDAEGLLGGSVAMGARQIPGSGPPRRRLHSGRFKSPVRTATTTLMATGCEAVGSLQPAHIRSRLVAKTWQCANGGHSWRVWRTRPRQRVVGSGAKWRRPRGRHLS